MINSRFIWYSTLFIFKENLKPTFCTLYVFLSLKYNTVQLSPDTARKAEENADRKSGRTKMFAVHKTKYTGLGVCVGVGVYVCVGRPNVGG